MKASVLVAAALLGRGGHTRLLGNFHSWSNSVSQEALREVRKPEEAAEGTACVHMRHFEAAMQSVQPSVSAKDQRVYDTLRQKLRR